MILTCEDKVDIAKTALSSGLDLVGHDPDRAMQSLDVADCCRAKGRFDLASQLVEMVKIERFPGNQELVERVDELRKQIEARDAMPSDEMLEQEPVATTVTVKKKSSFRGLGDVVAAGIKVVTLGRVRPCGGCGRRINWLNKVVPNPFQAK